MQSLIKHLTRLTDPASGPRFLSGGVARITANGTETAFLTGRAGPAPTAVSVTDPSLRLRMASVSKAATARAAAKLAVAGTIDLDQDIRRVLGWQDPPDALVTAPITARMLLSHTSGLTDLGGYIPEPGANLREFLADRADVAISNHHGGRHFRYANLNYVLIGAILEQVSGQRFDRLVHDLVLRPAGIGGGFNWAGVAIPLRQHRLPLYQSRDGTLSCTADCEDWDWDADVVWGGGKGYRLDDTAYTLGNDTILFSPHAGLRMSVAEMARLARELARDDAAGRLQRRVHWRSDAADTTGEDCEGLYQSFGLGVMIYRDHNRISGHRIGHAGHALGITCGAWHNVETGDSLAYFLNGSPDLTDGLNDEVFYDDDELPFLNAV